MSTDHVRRANLAAIVCDSPRPHLPEGFRRSSANRIGASLGAARTGLSVYELPPGQASSPYHYEDPVEEWLLVVYPDSDMVRMFSTDGTDDILVERKSALDLADVWLTGQPRSEP
ncbi:MAG: hypothetical protein ABSF58_00145 [Solirubrobacteraceae bacterium]